MTAILTDPPAVEPVTLAAAKRHLRVDGADEDAAILDLIAAARRHVEAATGRALLEQGWRIIRDDLRPAGIVRLEPAPVLSVDAVTLRDLDGTARVLAPADYVVDLPTTRIRVLPEARRSVAGCQVEIDITAGYGTEPAHVPAPLRQAILLLVAHWYAHREAALAPVPEPLTLGVDSLVRPYRLTRVA
ncbi:head-tail connector protein [Amorphus coralli]|uniref:head-tail connector protein n=1 Tax=Amorphus coralli TaxID=340680 RepID=UPI00035C624C|nr:head-tail connector protein [Amorphus coralli]